MEFVLVVPRRDLFPECYPHGLVPFEQHSALAEFERAVETRSFFVERARAEVEPAWKQVIPYTIVTRRGRSGFEVLLLRRTKRGGEARLHGKLSIGVGGHVNPPDLDAASDSRAGVIENGSRREIEEEIAVDGTMRITSVGLLNDDSNAVGAVHVGLVQVARVEGSVQVRETDVLEGEFVTPEHLRRLARESANFETWSALLIDRIEALLNHAEQQLARLDTLTEARA